AHDDGLGGGRRLHLDVGGKGRPRVAGVAAGDALRVVGRGDLVDVDVDPPVGVVGVSRSGGVGRRIRPAPRSVDVDGVLRAGRDLLGGRIRDRIGPGGGRVVDEQTAI